MFRFAAVEKCLQKNGRKIELGIKNKGVSSNCKRRRRPTMALAVKATNVLARSSLANRWVNSSTNASCVGTIGSSGGTVSPLSSCHPLADDVVMLDASKTLTRVWCVAYQKEATAFWLHGWCFSTMATRSRIIDS